MVKYQVKKTQITPKNKDLILNEKQIYLHFMLTGTKAEIKRINKILGNLNHNLKIIKQLIDEVK